MFPSESRTRHGLEIHTEWHFDDICDAFDAHQGERNHRHDGNSGPTEFPYQDKREGKQIQGDALLEMNAIYSAKW